MSNLFRLILSDSSINLKLVIIMNKNFVKIVFEILKAIVYALGGFFGGNALM